MPKKKLFVEITETRIFHGEVEVEDNENWQDEARQVIKQLIRDDFQESDAFFSTSIYVLNSPDFAKDIYGDIQADPNWGM